VLVTDMVRRQPWLSADDVTIPVEVSFRATGSAPTVFAPTAVREWAAERPRPRPGPPAENRPRPRPQPKKPVGS
jgi:hypothetical protein